MPGKIQLTKHLGKYLGACPINANLTEYIFHLRFSIPLRHSLLLRHFVSHSYWQRGCFGSLGPESRILSVMICVGLSILQHIVSTFLSNSYDVVASNDANIQITKNNPQNSFRIFSQASEKQITLLRERNTINPRDRREIERLQL